MIKIINIQNRTKKLLLTAIVYLFLLPNIHAQITIGTCTQPTTGSILDLKQYEAGIDNSTADKGMILPRVALQSETSLAPLLTGTALTNPVLKKKLSGTVVYNVTNDGNLKEGFYYWNGQKWMGSTSQGWGLNGNTGTNPTSNFLGTIDDNDLIFKTKNTERIRISSVGNVAIGTSTPEPSAILELNSSNKGFLGPKVALNSTTDQVTIANPAVGLLVYNLGTGSLKTTGYLYWNGSEWVQFMTGTTKAPNISALLCENARISPKTYKAGVPYQGVLIVPYSGGNGGSYSSKTPITSMNVSGLTATLQPGNLSYGNGELIYNLSGTPSASSPTKSAFPIEFSGQGCFVIVGEGEAIDQGEIVHYSTSIKATLNDVWLSDYIHDLPLIGGKLRLDAWFHGSSSTTLAGVTMWPRLVNTSIEPAKIWFSAITSINKFSEANYLIAPQGYVDLDDGIFLNLGNNDISTSKPRPSGGGKTNTHQEVVTVDLRLDNKWYRIYYFPIVDNMNTADKEDDQRVIHLSIQRLF